MNIRNNLFFIGVCAFLLIGCGFDAYFKLKPYYESLTKALEKNCKCEGGIFVTSVYENDNKKGAVIELIDCKFDDPELETKRIDGLFKREMVNYCDLNEVSITFINKGVRKENIYKVVCQ